MTGCLMMRVRAVFILWVLGVIQVGLSPEFAMAGDCEDWVAKVVSVQGRVQAKRTGQTRWYPVRLNDIFCHGDRLRVMDKSRAAVVLKNESLLRLDQKTAISFKGIEKKRPFLIDMLRGAIHFFSRKPKELEVATPFVNGAVEGTEFFFRVEENQTLISVFQGRVRATNQRGRLHLMSGQSGVAKREEAPLLRTVIRPRDAVNWAVYYPPTLIYHPSDFTVPTENLWQTWVRRSIEAFHRGDVIHAFAVLENIPSEIEDSRFFTYRAGLLLSVGRVEEAGFDLERALMIDPSNADARALQAVVSVALNRKEQALSLARKAVILDPESPSARIALSYALQAHFDLRGALKSLKRAVDLDPESALVHSRLSELWLSLGYTDKALEAAQKAVALNPNLARTQSVLGFAYLIRMKVREAKRAFDRAIALDQADPLSRLGLGLAKIREGDLHAGRAHMEIAAGLDPNNALIRSYLGKAYYDEKRDPLAREAFETAKKLDPLDPTPHFYDAIRKQTINRSVEALQDLQKSIELNDHRAVYRSRLMLDQDLAARSASMGRIYRDLGFEQLALSEGWKSLNTDPGNYSAHRFLADAYSALPRHEIARVSELLQSQLLQPINITPIQPRLAEGDLLFLEGSGPAEQAFNEFNPLFQRNRLSLQGGLVGAEKDTFGEEIVQSGLWHRTSYSLGQFHYETDGFRSNNDMDRDLYNAFIQVLVSPDLSVQAEYRYSNTATGDLPLRFDPLNFSQNRRQHERVNLVRIGGCYRPVPETRMIVSVIGGNTVSDAHDHMTATVPLPPPFGPVNVRQDLDLTGERDELIAELQVRQNMGRFRFIGGLGHFDRNGTQTNHRAFQPSLPPFFQNGSLTLDDDIRHTHVHAYAMLDYPEKMTWTMGSSLDFFKSGFYTRDQWNPKAGLLWRPYPGTTVRTCLFRVLKRALVSKQTIEPTQVSGFNQFFDDTLGTASWRYGIGMDQKLTGHLSGGWDLSKRTLDVPIRDIQTGGLRCMTARKEEQVRAYLYWTPHPWFALGAEYFLERFERQPDAPGVEDIVDLETHRMPLAVKLFHPTGLGVGLKGTLYDQEGDFGNAKNGIVPDGDRFWLLDASLSYRLPGRWGLITIEGKNLTEEAFRFQDMDPLNPRICPERLFLVKMTFAF